MDPAVLPVLLGQTRSVFNFTHSPTNLGNNATTVHIAEPEGVRARFTLAELLPQSFGPDHLRTVKGGAHRRE
jgi:hypothetical protein